MELKSDAKVYKIPLKRKQIYALNCFILKQVLCVLVLCVLTPQGRIRGVIHFLGEQL